MGKPGLDSARARRSTPTAQRWGSLAPARGWAWRAAVQGVTRHEACQVRPTTAQESNGAPNASPAVEPGVLEAGAGCNAFWDWEPDSIWQHPSPVRAHLLETDPGLNQNLISSAHSVAQLFNQDSWERHRRPERYWLNLQRMRHSTVLRRISQPCAALTLFTAVVALLNTFLPASWPRLSMSLAPHMLLGGVIGLLLVFRTNSSYARFVEGRALWGGLVRHSRDWTRLTSTYLKGELRGRAVRYVQVLAFVLKSHLRSGRTRDSTSDPTAFKDEPNALVHELLPKHEAEALLAEKNRPFYMLLRMTHLARDFQTCGAPRHVLHALERTLSELLAVVGGCERLLGTPIPLSFTRHTSRSLMLWLGTLPFALWGGGAGWLSVPAIALISFVILGIDEIGVEIEEPFCVLPLLPLCRTIVNDVKMAMELVEHGVTNGVPQGGTHGCSVLH
mmetsp:Transcript_2158/g.3500  ORF Transcript_2158/g.3500 Transcript_2158/m.3500 type:complete len:447 (+) Transcript_2158:74-1414(+)